MLAWSDTLILGTGIAFGYVLLTAVAVVLAMVLGKPKMAAEESVEGYQAKRAGPGRPASSGKEMYGTSPGGVVVEAYGPQLVKPISSTVRFT